MVKKVSMVSLCLGAVAFSATLSADDRIDLGDRYRNGRDLGRDFRPIPLCAIDLAATSLNFQLLNRTSTYRGQVRITGVLKNVGRLSYLSGARQQSLNLYEDRRLVATVPFVNLAVSGSVTVNFVRNWDASSAAEGEFPPTYKIILSQDPDIYIDGNVNNDDCNTRNNTFTRSGSAINDLL